MAREPEDALADKRHNEANNALHTFLGFSYHDSFQVDEDTAVQVNDGRISLIFASRMSFDEHRGKLQVEPRSLEKQYRKREEELSEALRARDNALSLLEEARGTE